MTRKRSLGPCTEPGCPTLTRNARCPTHTKPRTGPPGSTTARGYGWQHQQARAAWTPRVATGTIPCSRCQNPIQPGQAWDLDHTPDRTRYLGPAHARCNRAAKHTPPPDHDTNPTHTPHAQPDEARTVLHTHAPPREGPPPPTNP